MSTSGQIMEPLDLVKVKKKQKKKTLYFTASFKNNELLENKE